MKILDLRHENFQYEGSYELHTGCMSVDVYGDNGTGKTTIYNAATWLLYGKAADGAKNYLPKPKDADGNDVHNLETAVEAVLGLDDGREIRLRKVFKEIWRKKSGSETAVFSGHTTEYYIDGVPVKESEYIMRLMMDLAPSDQVQALMQPGVFASEWSIADRRSILLAMCGDVDGDDVFASRPELAELREHLLIPGTTDRFYTIEQFIQKAKATRTEINKRLDSLPSLINEARRAIPNMTGANEKEVCARIKELEGQKRELEAELAALRDDAGAADLRKRITAAEIELEEERLNWSRAKTETEGAFEKVLRALKSECEKIQADRSAAFLQRQLMQERLTKMKDDRRSCSDQYNAIAQQQWRGADVCPTCGQAIPAEQIEAAKAEFNKTKSEDLERIRNTVGVKCSLPMIAELEAKLAKADEELGEYDHTFNEQEHLVKAKEAERPAFPQFSDTEAYKRIDARIAQIKEDMEAPSGAAKTQTEAIQSKIAAIDENLAACREIMGDFATTKRQQKRVKELVAEEKSLAAELERVDHGVYLCNEFTRAKVAMLDERINNRFESVKFRLFTEQLNGGLKDDCEMLVPSESGALVPYNLSVNKAAKLNAGIELIEALSQHWGVKMPVFIDDAEGVTRPRPIDTQVWRLIVSEGDEKLRVELVEPAGVAV